MKRLIMLAILWHCLTSLSAQTGSENEPVRYIGGVTIDPYVHEG